jgi:hypothetical protein
LIDQTITLSRLESHLWESANILRGPVDAADFKTYIFPLLFFKRICDVWDEEYQEIVMNGGDAQAVMDFMMAYLPGWIGYMVYVLFILAVVITGIVLFIVFRKRFALDPGQIPKGQRFKTVICNPGMLCYCIFWIVMILLQMFPEIVQMLLGISPLSL